ncbi:BrnT family toxin [Treponema primitia]|uniref:BrnT family toxin n=1 Tax=Treponema primitia TaxID=88058 RepID=UPI0011D22BB5|nr:BrnT family toxin [Treponema primitia]
MIKFKWDPAKEALNFQSHGIHFETATNIFKDPFRMERHDDDSSDDEDRWQTMGFYNDVLFVAYTEREEYTWIISARLAEPFERRIYHEQGRGRSDLRGWERVNS